MSIRPSMWKAATPLRGGVVLSNREIDLRMEFDQLVFGDDTHVPHGKWLVLRRMRRQSNGYPEDCVCIGANTTREPDFCCSYCLGEGYLWDEEWLKGYSMYGGADSGFLRRETHVAPGFVRTDYKIFFLRYDTEIKYGDKIIEPLLDVEGGIEIPYIRSAIYKPQTINAYRSDNGRIEYIAVYCKEEDAVRNDNPQS